jgi:A/G-specific adenine glycosylase
VKEAGLRSARAPLLRWYRRNRRDLPWRRTSDPYAIWVSEVMLQQTQVATVLPYYERFLRRFPDLRSLAEAREEDVLAAWSGLGYYRRACSLREGARVVMERHGGKVPQDPVELLELPGVGRYTAGAIASVAFGRTEPVLDGNVRRVLSRLLARDGVGAAEERALWEAAGVLVRGRDPGDLNQALMELGATICTPRAPRCPVCPVSSSCLAGKSGTPEAFPRARPTRAPEAVRVAAALVERRGRVLLERPGAGSPLRGVWDLPAFEVRGRASAAVTIGRGLLSRHGLAVRVGDAAARTRHAILHRRLLIETYRCRLVEVRRSKDETLRWIRPASLDGVAVSGATRKLLGLAAPF